eukprot:5516451-Amphidinium_carterae.1
MVAAASPGAQLSWAQLEQAAERLLAPDRTDIVHMDQDDDAMSTGAGLRPILRSLSRARRLNREPSYGRGSTPRRSRSHGDETP